MNRVSATLAGCCLACWCAGAQAVPPADPYFLPLGDLPGGSNHGLAQDVSADGSVVVGRSSTTGGTEAFVWTAETGLVGLGDLPGGNYFSDAIAVSADGSTVVGRSNSEYSGPDVNHHEAFRWIAGEGMEGLGDFWGGRYSSVANDVSADGSVVVGYGYHGGVGAQREAFRWTEATWLVGLGGLQPVPMRYSDAEAVSADGSVVVGLSVTPWGTEAFRWTEATDMVGLGELPGGDYQSVATAVSADGSAVIGYTDVGIDTNGQRLHEVFRWTEATGMVGLGFYGWPEDVSADGSVIVGEYRSVPFVWHQVHGVRDLADILTDAGVDLGEWTLYFANGVSADGCTIVGCAYPASRYLEAYVAHIPDPTALKHMTIETNLPPRPIP